VLSNGQIAELLAREAQDRAGILQKALRRAACLAFLWPEEAAVLLAQGRPLTELPGIGPHLQRIITPWIQKRPDVPVPDPTRAGFLTLTEARALLQKNKSWAQRLRGDLQMHTHWSDGSGSIHQMATEGLDRGYEYIAITDHGQGLKIAGGMTEAELARQISEIDAENAAFSRGGVKLRVLRSIEVNLDPAGQADMSPASLAGLDLVLGSFHSALRRKDDQTSRYIAALDNPSVQILGHPRGRIYNYRFGLMADWPKVFSHAAELDKAVEIDAYPDRQDLSLDLLEHARAAGVRISIGTDAHSPTQLGFIELGLAAALKARIPPERIVNFMSREELLAWSDALREATVSSIPA
jgi:putative hydrolase